MSSRPQHLVVVLLDAVARVDQHIDALQRHAALEIVEDQLRPVVDLLLRRLRVAVARHVDQRHRRQVAGLAGIAVRHEDS